MRKTIDILGVKIDSITMDDACKRVIDLIYGDGIDEGSMGKDGVDKDAVHSVYTPNAEILMAAQRDRELKDILNRGELVVPDGAGVVLASKILKRRVPEKVSGIDLIKRIISYGEKAPVIFMFGGKPGVAELSRDNVLKQYPGVKIAGVHHGYFTAEEEPAIIEKINNSGAELLLVALGAPKQEKWIDSHRNTLKVKVCIGVGGSLDVFAGKAKLAPEFIRKIGLEWLYRLIREPRRFKRMLDIPRFMLKVIRQKPGRC
ncbi:MAG: WecB/TagA/CpsF family glycosyltransferase [Eubacteriales bacterium]|nr:WecB/TagA/CpsF family glycosyltransferase [Eubacteriales bacterium]